MNVAEYTPDDSASPLRRLADIRRAQPEHEMIDFSEPRLVAKYGSWVRVQTAFFDFLVELVSGHCAGQFNQELADAIAADGFSATDTYYEHHTRLIEEMFATPTAAWVEFVAQEFGTKKPAEK